MTAAGPRAFNLHASERALTNRTEAAIRAAIDAAAALAFRALPLAFAIRPACELTAALARRLRRPR